MNWITNYVRPRINSMLGRREVPENLWIKCPETGEMVFHKDLEENKWVIPASGYHMKMPAKARLIDLFDNGLPVVAFHGTNQPDLIGTQASNGCRFGETCRSFVAAIAAAP